MFIEEQRTHSDLNSYFYCRLCPIAGISLSYTTWSLFWKRSTQKSCFSQRSCRMCRKLQKSSRYSCGVAIACASFVGFTIYRPVGSTCAKWILEIVFAVSLPPTTGLKSMLWVIQAFGYSHMQSKTLNYSCKKWGPRLSWLLVLKYKWKRDTWPP